MNVTIVALAIGGSQPGIEPMLERFGAGLSEAGAEMATSVIERSTEETRIAALVAQAKASAGVVLVAGEQTGETASSLDRLHDVAVRVTPDWELIGVFGQAVGASLAALPPTDPQARQVIHALNARLYDWGAVIVSPGFGQRSVAPWYDNRPGDLEPDGTLSSGAAGALESHARRLARVAALLHGKIGPLTGELR
jgi:hypothetical protein